MGRETQRNPQEAYAEALRRIETCRQQGDTLLDLHALSLETLPPEIGQLTALTELCLWDNRLTTLPPEISQLTATTELHLANNQFTTLPPEIGRLTALTQLFLYDNRLTTLPPEIGQLANLRWLNLMDNRLATLPEALRDLPKLEFLLLHGNPALGVSPSVLGPDPRKTDEGWALAKPILDFYFGRNTGQSRP